MIKKLSIINLAYNEEKTIYLILDKVINVELINSIEKEIIIVDDYSIDQTLDAIRKYIQGRKLEHNINLLTHEQN